MATEFRHLLPAMSELASSPRPIGLGRVGDLVHLSGGRAQRAFRSIIGESPDQYQRRIRLQRAAALLRGTDSRIIDIAVASGFESHEAFSRSFRRAFGRSPRDYRHIGDAWTSPQAMKIVATTAPCVGLYRKTVVKPTKDRAMSYDIERRTIEPIPILYAARRIEIDKVADALGEILPMVFGYAMENGIEMTGPPFVRYVESSPAFVSLEGGVPTASKANPPLDRNDVLVGELQGGAVARTIHRGPYDTLGEAHAALDRWMAAEGVASAGAPWEVYLTDPAEVPDPNDWETELLWPIAD